MIKNMAPDFQLVFSLPFTSAYIWAFSFLCPCCLCPVWILLVASSQYRALCWKRALVYFEASIQTFLIPCCPQRLPELERADALLFPADILRSACLASLWASVGWAVSEGPLFLPSVSSCKGGINHVGPIAADGLSPPTHVLGFVGIPVT